MRFKHTLATFICLSALAVVIPANSAIIGPAGNYNVFVFGNYESHGADTQGNLAAGGDVTLTPHSVATLINGDSGARLDAGGSVTASNGGVGSDQNGMIYTSDGSGISSSFTSFNSKNSVGYSPSPIDFSAAETMYQNLSASWGDLTSGYTTTHAQYGSLNLTGTDAALNMFSIVGSELKDVTDLRISAPAGSTVLINVSGSGQTFKDGSVFLNGGIDSAHIIYNFYESTELTLFSGKNLMGSILAPNAAVGSNGPSNGALDGQLIAQSYVALDGEVVTQFHNVLFEGEITPVPVPAAFWLFGSAIGFIAVRLHRNSIA